MSKAETLANFLEFHFTEYERCHPNDAPMCESAAAELRRLAQVEAEHEALKEELEAEREETKRWRNAAKWEQEIRKQAEMIAGKAVTEHSTLLKAISDAEPVAWIWRYANGEEEVVFVPPDVAKQLDPSECDVPSTITPLYTINGIKKP